MMPKYASALAAGAASLLVLACAGKSPELPADTGVDSGMMMMPPPNDTDAALDSPAVPPADAPSDGYTGPLPPPEGGSPDGTPMRQQCTSNFGSALDTSYGRMDGYLVAIVPQTAHGCNADQHHVHLQVMINGSVYDVAIDIYSTQDTDPYVSIDEISHALVGGAWAEGWHTTNVLVDYVSTLGLHSTQFTETQEAPLATQIETALANANHVSVYVTGYGPTGGHDVHRNSGGHDGAVVIYPLSNAPQWVVFHFSSQSF